MKRFLLLASVFMSGVIAASTIEAPAEPLKKQFQLSVATMFRDEAPRFVEWIEYHRMVGVEHFWLYNDRSTDNYAEVLKPYIEDGTVEVFNWVPSSNVSYISNQVSVCRDALKKAKNSTEWFAFIDIDEFLLPVQEKTVTECLNKHFSQAAGIYVNWHHFGTGGIFLKDGESMLMRLTACGHKLHPTNGIGKSIVRPEHVRNDDAWNVHHYPLDSESFYCDGDVIRLLFNGWDLALDGKNHSKFIRLNHYRMGDENFFHKVRLERTQNTGLQESLLWEHYHAYNLDQDDSMITFIREKHPEMYKKFWEPRTSYNKDTSAWLSFKNETVSTMSTIPGWCSKGKAFLIMDIIKENKCQNCVEIGVFAGMSLFPIIKALHYNGGGKVFAIDAWNAHEATKGFSKSDPNYKWWNELDYDSFYQQTIKLINQNKLSKYCSVIKQPFKTAINLFADETIDFIHFDGNHNEEEAFQDVITYFSKVKNDGYILLNDSNWLSMKKALTFLLERTELISSSSPSATYVLLRKDEQKVKAANAKVAKQNSLDNDIKILVLIISSDDHPVYSELQKIWRSYMHNDPEHVEAYFIRGNPDLPTLYHIDGDTIWSQTKENLAPGVLNKTLLSLEAFIPKIDTYNYILRTNLSSFYVFPRLLKFLKTLPKTRCYCASAFSDELLGHGSGFLISPDVAKIMVNNKKILFNDASHADDVLIGRFIKQNQKIPLIRNDRMDFYEMFHWDRDKDTIIGNCGEYPADINSTNRPLWPFQMFHFRIKFSGEERLKNDIYVQSMLLKMFGYQKIARKG